MTTFAYTALEPSGRKSQGVLEAATREAAIESIAGGGRLVLQIEERKSAQGSSIREGGGRVRKADIALFTRRMADLSAAGLPLDRVLQVVSEQSESARLSAIALEALDQVKAGMPVSDALAAFPKVFPTVYTQTLRAGEASGQFPAVASRLADLQEKEVALRSHVTSAMVYPAILTATAVSVVIFMITFVLPKLEGVFADLGGELPKVTQILMASSNAVTNYGLFWLAGIAVAVIVYRGWVATELGATSRDRALLKLPFAGSVIGKALVSRFARVLATLVYGGVPILEALRLSGLASGNRVFSSAAAEVEARVREGKPIADAMREAEGFPPVLTHMVAIGEETGDLPKMLGRVADSMDFEVEIGLRRLTTSIEPVIVLSMGLFVGFVVLSVVLPIFQAQDLVK